MAMTAAEIEAEIRETASPVTFDPTGAKLAESLQKAQHHAEGLRDEHVLAALAQPDNKWDAWQIDNEVITTLLVSPPSGGRQYPILCVIAQNSFMEASITGAWKLRGEWAGTTPTALFAEFVARFGFPVRLGNRDPSLFTGHTVVEPGVELFNASGHPDKLTISATVRVDSQTGEQDVRWAYGLRLDEYERFARTTR